MKRRKFVVSIFVFLIPLVSSADKLHQRIGVLVIATNFQNEFQKNAEIIISKMIESQLDTDGSVFVKRGDFSRFANSYKSPKSFKFEAVSNGIEGIVVCLINFKEKNSMNIDTYIVDLLDGKVVKEIHNSDIRWNEKFIEDVKPMLKQILDAVKLNFPLIEPKQLVVKRKIEREVVSGGYSIYEAGVQTSIGLESGKTLFKGKTNENGRFIVATSEEGDNIYIKQEIENITADLKIHFRYRRFQVEAESSFRIINLENNSSFSKNTFGLNFGFWILRDTLCISTGLKYETSSFSCENVSAITEQGNETNINISSFDYPFQDELFFHLGIKFKPSDDLIIELNANPDISGSDGKFKVDGFKFNVGVSILLTKGMWIGLSSAGSDKRIFIENGNGREELSFINIKNIKLTGKKEWKW